MSNHPSNRNNNQEEKEKKNEPPPSSVPTLPTGEVIDAKNTLYSFTHGNENDDNNNISTNQIDTTTAATNSKQCDDITEGEEEREVEEEINDRKSYPPPVLPSGQMIDAKNTLQSFHNLEVNNSNNTNYITTNTNHIQQNPKQIPTLPTGEVITGKNTLQSFDDRNMYPDYDNVIYGRYPSSSPSPNTAIAETVEIESNDVEHLSTNNDDDDNPIDTVVAVPIFDCTDSNIHMNETPELNARLVLMQENSYTKDENNSSSTISIRRNHLYAMAVCFVVVLITVVVIMSILYKNSSKTGVVFTPNFTEPVLTEFINNITFSDQKNNIIATGNSPESKALHWLAKNKPIELQVISPISTSTLSSVSMNEISFRISQRYALVTLWFQQPLDGGKTWLHVSNWLVDPNECNWFGVFCYDLFDLTDISYNYPYVVSTIDFYVDESNTGNGITGSIPADFGLLTHLQTLNFDSNELTGTLPESIGQWTSLRDFWIFENNITGTLPESIGQWTSLSFFWIFGNNINGTLPESIGQWTALSFFWIFENNITGTLPESIGQWTSIYSFDVSDNMFTGTIPESISQWDVIEDAYFYNNSLTGSVPEGICNGAYAISPQVDTNLNCTCCIHGSF